MDEVTVKKIADLFKCLNERCENLQIQIKLLNKQNILMQEQNDILAKHIGLKIK